jgi:DMSO/TMAO reductase YedYZ molybdopterin-dependent catalytic subunit
VGDSTRRRFLEASTAAAVAAWMGSSRGEAQGSAAPGGGERQLSTLPFLGEGAFPVERTVGQGLGRRRALDLATLAPAALVTPADRFFIRTGRPDRLPAVKPWKVRVHGRVDAPVEIEVAELERQATPQGLHLLECAGNSRNAHFGFMSAARWTGVPLAALLKRVGRRPGATQVLVAGFDEHSAADRGSVPGASWIFRLDHLGEAGAFLATSLNGAPLGPDHGYPLRLVVPGWYACTAIKWVNEIALVDDDAPATDHMREYAGRTHQDPAGPLARDFQPATIDPAAVAVRVDKLRARSGEISYRVAGIHWGGRTPARALGIRLPPDRRFVPVDRIDRRDGAPWALWSHTFRDLAPGRYRVELAVTDPRERTRRLDTGYYAREVEITGV